MVRRCVLRHSKYHQQAQKTTKSLLIEIKSSFFIFIFSSIYKVYCQKRWLINWSILGDFFLYVVLYEQKLNISMSKEVLKVSAKLIKCKQTKTNHYCCNEEGDFSF